MQCISVLIYRFDDAHSDDMAEMATVACCAGSGRDRAPARDRSGRMGGDDPHHHRVGYLA